MEKLSGRSNVFIISKRQSSLSNKFYHRKQTLQARGHFRYCSHWLTWPVSSLSILHSDLITSVTKCNRGIYTFHWILVAPQALKCVLPVADSFSNKKMRTFSRIGAHQSTSEAFNTSLWSRKAKPASVNYFAIVVLAINKTCGTFPQEVSVFFMLWNIMFLKWIFITMSKRTCIIFQQIFPHFFRVYWLARGPETDIVASSDSVTHHIYRVFDDTSWGSSATALQVKLGLFSSLCKSKSVTTCSSIFCSVLLHKCLRWTSLPL